MNREGALYFATGIDNTGMRRDADESKQIIDSITDAAKKAGAAMGIALGVGTLKNFVGQMFKVRSEFQDTESSMKVFLGSAEKASDFMKKLQDYAWYNMFEFSDLTKESAKLLAFGNDVDSVIPILDKLSNIAAGTKQPLSEFVDLYDKAKNVGKIDAMGLESWATKGVVITDVLKQMGVEVDRSNISFEHLEMVLNKLTSTGGMFSGLMSEQMNNLSASYGQLQDDISIMFNEIGEKSQGMMKGAIDVADNIIKNYEKVGKTILEIAATYGVYRAALIAVTALEKQKIVFNKLVQEQMLIEQALRKGASVEMIREAAVTKALAITKQNLVASLKAVAQAYLANPYVLAAAAITVAAYATYKLITYQTEAEKAQNRLNDAMKESEKSALSEQRELARLKGELSSLEKGSDAYNKVKDKIIANYSKYDKNLAEEINKVGLLEGTYKNLTKAITDSFNARGYAKFAQEQSDNLDEVMSKNLGKIQDKLINKLGDEAGAKYYAKIREAIFNGSVSVNNGFKAEGLDAETQAALDKISGKADNKWIQNYAIEEYIKNVLTAQNLTDELDKKARNKFGIGEDIITEEDGENAKTIFSSISDEIKSATGNVSKLKKELSDLRSGKKTSENYAQDIENKTKELKEAEDKLHLLLGTDKNTDKSALKNAEDIAKAILDAELTLEKARLDNMIDGKDKRLKQSELEFKEREAQINDEEKKLQKLYKEQGKAWNNDKDGTVFQQQRVENTKAKENRDTKIDDEYKKEYTKMLQELTDALLKEEEKRKKAIADRYKLEREEYDKMLKRGDIDTGQHENLIKASTTAETKEQLDRILENVQDFKRQEKDINDKFNTLINDETIAGNEELTAQLEKQRTDALSKIHSQMLQESDEWKNLFIGLDKLTADQIDALVAKIEASDGMNKLTPQELKAIVDQLERAKGVSAQLRSLNPFDSLRKGFELLKTDSKKALEQIANDLNNISSMFGAVGDSLSSIFSAFGNDAAAQTTQHITNIATGALSAGQGVAKLASGDIVGGVVDLAKGIGSVVSGIIGLGDSKHQKRIEQLQKTIDSLDERIKSLKKTYEELGRAADEAYSKAKSDFIGKQNEALAQENELIRQQNEDIKKQIKEEKDKKKTDNNAIKAYEEQIKANEDAIEANKRQMEENKKAAIDAIVGTDIKTAINDFANAYIDAWKSGEKAAIGSANVAKKILIGALTEAMKGDISGYVEALNKKIADAMSNDGKIDDAEQAAIDAIVAGIDNIASRYEDAFKPYLDDLDEKQKGVTGELQAAMTEGTASQLVGLWNMTAMDIRAMKEMMQGYSFPNVEKELNIILNELNAINRNTLRSADNTDGIKNQFDDMNDKLEEIKKNTKSNNSRG